MLALVGPPWKRRQSGRADVQAFHGGRGFVRANSAEAAKLAGQAAAPRGFDIQEIRRVLNRVTVMTVRRTQLTFSNEAKASVVVERIRALMAACR